MKDIILQRIVEMNTFSLLTTQELHPKTITDHSVSCIIYEILQGTLCTGHLNVIAETR
jgi:hypothetical protein